MAKPIKKKPKFAPVKLKTNPLKEPGAGEIDYKNIDLLKKFIQDRGKIRSREITGVTVREQRAVALAIKNARELALLPFVAAGNAGKERKGGRRNG